MEDPVGFASKMNAMPKYVVSATLTDPAWNNTTVITLQEAGKLKDQYQGDILIAGSGQLVRALTGLGLVDEYRLMVFPLILGAGQRLFDGAARTRLKLADITSIGPDGVTVQRYMPASSYGPGCHPGPSGLAAYPETVTFTPASRSQSPVVAVACTTALALGA